MVDFKRQLKAATLAKKLSPIDIYNDLYRSAVAAGPLRPVQEEILNTWYTDHFNDRDVIVKLHTGEGKTLVGLLMLQAKINAGKGPCVFVCPNIQLAEQVKRDAEKFGIRYCTLDSGDSYMPQEFLDGKAILITYVQKVFNGRTVFGLDNRGERIGTFLLDDSHACIDSIRSSFTMRIPRISDVYKRLLEMFRESLTEQGPGDFHKIQSTESETTVMLIPYWDWIHKTSDVLQLLSEYEEAEKNIAFTLPLLRNILTYCNAYVTGRGIEIVPDYMLTDRFTSYSEAECRIMMSATTQDDSFFIKGLGFSPEAVKHPLCSSRRLWSGEKMILFPTLIDDKITTYSVREWIIRERPRNRSGIVVLVPSYRIAYDNYRDQIIPSTADMEKVIQYLGSGSCPHPVVFANRYDGMDLADGRCRILVMDSLPYFDTLADRYEQSCRQGSNLIDTKIAQKIEQGLGRSVRSEKDFSVILVLGEDLIRFMRSSKNQAYFSAQTRCQIHIGDTVTSWTAEEVDPEHPLVSLVTTIKQCTDRDESWKEYYAQEMTENVRESSIASSDQVIDIVEKEYEVEKALKNKDLVRACRRLNKLIDGCTDVRERGWYQQQLAKYTFMQSEQDYATHQYNAHYNNPYLLIPDNFPYKKLGTVNTSRLESIRRFLAKFETYLDLKVFVDELRADLTFGVSSEKFESAMQQLGLFLGFESQRPDHDYKKGPDNLWHSGNGTFFSVECKNQVERERRHIYKEEAGQMTMHIGWFEKHYPDVKDVTYLWVHPTNVLTPSADMTHPCYCITPDKLDYLKKQLAKYSSEYQECDLTAVDEDYIKRLLQTYMFTEKALVRTYMVPVKETDKL